MVDQGLMGADKSQFGDSDEAEHRFRREAERYSWLKLNSDRSEATLAF